MKEKVKLTKSAYVLLAAGILTLPIWIIPALIGGIFFGLAALVTKGGFDLSEWLWDKTGGW